MPAYYRPWQRCGRCGRTGETVNTERGEWICPRCSDAAYPFGPDFRPAAPPPPPQPPPRRQLDWTQDFELGEYCDLHRVARARFGERTYTARQDADGIWHPEASGPNGWNWGPPRTFTTLEGAQIVCEHHAATDPPSDG